MSALFVILVLMAFFFLLFGIRDICMWFDQRSRQHKAETKRWKDFHDKFEERP